MNCIGVNMKFQSSQIVKILCLDEAREHEDYKKNTITKRFQFADQLHGNELM